MMGLEQWLKTKQKMSMEYFTSLKNKDEIYKKFDEYRARTARFNSICLENECREVAKEIVALY